jgi:hypothetical protein
MRLVKNVAVDGTWYGPAHGNADQVPAEVASQITNPKAWEGSPEQSSGDDRDALLDRAAALGVKIHGNEKDSTIRRKIEEAESGE